jgi:hypothetical protein
MERPFTPMPPAKRIPILKPIGFSIGFLVLGILVLALVTWPYGVLIAGCAIESWEDGKSICL